MEVENYLRKLPQSSQVQEMMNGMIDTRAILNSRDYPFWQQCVPVSRPVVKK